MIVSIVIFVVTYLVIAFTRVPNATAALLGASAMVFSGALSAEQAFAHVDLNVILLLAGMMTIAEIVGRTGAFEWMAIQSARAVRGNGFGILTLLCCITAVASALLDNVTTVVLLLPVTLSICRSLELDPLPFLLGEVFASNIGGAATLIGDPPNVIIASVADIDFLPFVLNLTPIIIVSLVLLLGLLFLWFRHRLDVPESKRRELLTSSANSTIGDRGLLVRSTVVMLLTVVGFIVHGFFDISPAFVALGGAAVLMFLSGIEPAAVLPKLQWSALFFFVGIFIVVGGLVENGVLEKLQGWLVEVTGGSQSILAVVLVSFSGLISSLVDNIPYAATMSPVVKDIAGSASGNEISPLWWALSLGSNLGGNFTVVGASANVLVVDRARESGYPISFLEFLKYGAVVGLCTLGLATGYIWLRFFL